MFATGTSRVVRCLGRPAVVRRALCKTTAVETTAMRAFSTKIDHLNFSTKIDRAIGGVMNKEFPGYFDKNHHKGHSSTDSVLDVHDHRKDLDADQNGKQLTCAKVVKILEQHPAVHECVVIDINVEQHGEIPVAFVVKKPGSERTIKNNDELHTQLVDSLRATLGPNHEELENDLVKKLDAVLEDKSISNDLIRDELVNYVRDEVGPYAILKVVIVDDLPKTVSGKILRGTLFKIARGEPYTITPMIQDRNVLARLEKEINGLLGVQYEACAEK